MAGEKENVLIQSGDCCVTLMPPLGGKIASLRVGPDELLQTPLNPYAARTRTMAFSEGDASGWDECLPSVAGCTLKTETGSITVPDHGDLWRVPWQVLNATEDSATLRANCFSLPLQMTRSLLLSQRPSGWQLQLLYSLTNLGAYCVPWSWAAHPLFAVDTSDRVILPNSIRSLAIEGSSGDYLGARGETVKWPQARTFPRGETDLSLTHDAHRSTGDKLFAGPLTPSDNWAALERKRLGLRLTVHFDPVLTPYLGLWLCYGGWPDGDGKKQVCVALEPSTAPVDSLALTGPWSRSLEPGETCTWPMELRIERMPIHKG